MTRGLGERQRKDRLVTTSKISSYLAVRPFNYQDLQRESKIQRKRLRDGLNELVMRKIVIRHRFSIQNDPNLERNSIYYLLNWSKTESKQLVKYYYNNSSTNNKDTMLNNKDEKPVHNGIDQPSVVDQFRTTIKKIEMLEESAMSHEEWRQLRSAWSQLVRKLQLGAVKKGVYLYDTEPPEESTIRLVLELVNSALSKEWSFLDVLVKLSADEKIEEATGIYQYYTLWEIIEKTGLLDKYKNEIH